MWIPGMQRGLRDMKALFVVLLLAALDAQAWMDRWAPAVDAKPAKVRMLPAKTVGYFVRKARGEDNEGFATYSEGCALDLNGDGIEDFVIVIPWMGCGLGASAYQVIFVVSNGAGWRTETVMNGFGIEVSDLVTVGGKTYFRHSEFFSEFVKSKHNHWVYQMFSFDKHGNMKCANADFKGKFPAVTVFYENPKFRQIELTAADKKKIAAEVKIESHRFAP